MGTKVNWDNEPLLGKVPDPVLADKYDVYASTVYNARKKRKIPACPESWSRKGKYRKRTEGYRK
jgi:hypothetical protein